MPVVYVVLDFEGVLTATTDYRDVLFVLDNYTQEDAHTSDTDWVAVQEWIEGEYRGDTRYAFTDDAPRLEKVVY